MFIQINTDNQIPSDAGRDAQIEEQVRQRLARFEERITDVEIHVSDVNGPRGGAADLRCTLEARVNGVPPVAVSDNGATVDRAILGAAKKAARALDHQLGKLSDRKGH
ncbi:MAG TPA: GPW/gp25 family protein [Allosphingosinicella sp.]|nr:GPW/gp25 family protein [Allosphingosinicella sp.]